MGMYREEVERGAAFLDRYHPGWREEINLERLELSRCPTCVLGQLAGGEDENWANLCLRFGIGEDTDADIDMGFCLDELDDGKPSGGWNALTEEWREYIRETRAGAGA